MGAAAAAPKDLPFEVNVITSFDEPWALAFLPDGRMLVTEKKGNLLIVTQDGQKSGSLRGMPDVAYGGQGGLGDVALHPNFAQNHQVYLSYAESGPGNVRGAAVARAVLKENPRGGGELSEFEVIWRQYPKVVGYGHYGHRLLFDKDGYLWISSGDRQKFTPAQDMQANLGKVLRLRDDGSIPDDNPFVHYFDENPLVDDEGIYGQIWSLGHRNVLGLAFGLDGELWEIEMGPKGGDELNRIRAGEELRLSDRVQRRPLRRSCDPRPRHAPGIREARRLVDPGHLTRELDHLSRQSVLRLARRCTGVRSLLQGNRARRSRRRRRRA